MASPVEGDYRRPAPQRPRFDFEAELESEREYAASMDAGTANPSYTEPEYMQERRIPGHGRPSSSSSSPYGHDPEMHRHGRARNADAYKEEEDVTLGQYILNRVGDAVKGLFRNSQTILRVDLRQAIRYDAGPVLRRKRRRQVAGGRGAPSRATRVAEAGFYEDDGVDAAAVQSRGWFHGLQGGGARLKLMQIWEFKDPETGQERLPWNINLGFGANVVMDRGEAQPKLRIRAQHAAFHFFPEPYLELRGKWPLGNTNLAIRARYRLPVSSMSRFWESASSQLMVNLYHRSGTGIHLTPGGVEFEDQSVPIGQFGTMRIAAAVDFPRQFPLEEGEQPFRLRITRLGLKSRIM